MRLLPLGLPAIESSLLPKVFEILLILDEASLMICFVQIWFFRIDTSSRRLTLPSVNVISP
jgi:hypothetical protein